MWYQNERKMKKIPYLLNQNHWRYSSKITSGFNEERIYDDSDDEFFEEAFEGNEFDEYEDDYSIQEMKWAA